MSFSIPTDAAALTDLVDGINARRPAPGATDTALIEHYSHAANALYLLACDLPKDDNTTAIAIALADIYVGTADLIEEASR
ncbi:hypothetical protein [Saccharothrix sp. NRRL B-16314]|uniref:hypothetical protein n=1 Tax=Saccharothrix sp. NRRL B-16314 TaxID=1463825 RepID=UPI000526F195|nr:hypothetical protein [Saccharothrix sp. NRRL B-16314]